MKKTVKNEPCFNKLSPAQMNDIKGGQWIEITNSDGTITRVWV